MIFGIYCEVSIETLKEVKLKYIEDYEGLVQYLTDFHLLPVKPTILAIDSLEFFVDNKRQGINQLTRQMRFNFLMSLIQNCKPFLTNAHMNPNNLVVSYKIGVHDFTQKADPVDEDRVHTNQVEFQKIFSEISRYTSQVYYIARNKITKLVDQSLLSEDQQNEIQKKEIDVYQVLSDPFYLDEVNKSRQRKRQQSDFQKANMSCWPMDYQLMSTTPEEDKASDFDLKYKNKQFESILKAIRDYNKMDED